MLPYIPLLRPDIAEFQMILEEVGMESHTKFA